MRNLENRVFSLMKTHLLLLVLFFFGSFASFAQEITGVVFNKKKEPIPFANVYWVDRSDGTAADEKGVFILKKKENSPNQIVAGYLGYRSDTITLTPNQTKVSFNLMADQTIKELVVIGKLDGVMISDLDPIKTEQITKTELRKAACCDLAGCFETSTTVQPQTTNVITNSKELRILGLSGVYNQVLVDGLPMIQALSYTYGISNIPGTMVNSIHVSKGANSVEQGYESISGQINVQTNDPIRGEKMLLNGYVNSFGETQYNAQYAFKKNKWGNLLAVHTVQAAGKFDRDGDGFLDLPQMTRYKIDNKWKYGDAQKWGWHSLLGVRMTNEERIGGQTLFNKKTDQGSSSVYGQTVSILQPEFWTKTGYRFNDNRQIVGSFSSYYQDQDSYFGTVHYNAQQLNFYGNIQLEQFYGDSASGDNMLKAGISYRNLNLSEQINFTDTSSAARRTYDGTYKRSESIPGVFVQNSLSLIKDKMDWISGVRADYHNQFGMRVTPRTLLKYNIRPKTTIRGSIGTGWRTVNLFSENIGLLISSRDIVFKEALQPEQAVNMGLNFMHKFKNDSNTVSGYLSIDFYRTSFQNQVFPNYDSSTTEVIVENFTGTSISNGAQIEGSIELKEQFGIKMGYNFLDVYRMVDGEKYLLPFNSKHKFLTALNFETKDDKFMFDVNAKRYGARRLPNTKTNPSELQRPDFSKPYTLVNAQFTVKLETQKHAFEVYGGCENIFDFRQLRPILSWEDPFSPYFDTSSVWGPTRGREFYLGVRYKVF